MALCSINSNSTLQEWLKSSSSVMCAMECCCFFFSSRRRHTRLQGDWSSDVCSSDLAPRSPDARGRSVPRREGRAAALSFLAHLAIAVLVLWRGAQLFQSGGGGAGPPGEIGRASCRERV